jgi:hypothetical protein
MERPRRIATSLTEAIGIIKLEVAEELEVEAEVVGAEELLF